jgi:glutamyl-tRNA(Gln) amidotransferase subunit E
LDLFEKFSKENDPVLVASTFTSVVKDLRRRGVDIDILSEEHFDDLFSSIKKKTISKEAIPNILETVCKEKISVNAAIEKSGLKGLSEEQLREIVRKVIRVYPHLVKENKISALMGEIMKEVRGRIQGSIVQKVLNEELKK